MGQGKWFSPFPGGQPALLRKCGHAMEWHLKSPLASPGPTCSVLQQRTRNCTDTRLGWGSLVWAQGMKEHFGTGRLLASERNRTLALFAGHSVHGSSCFLPLEIRFYDFPLGCFSSFFGKERGIKGVTSECIEMCSACTLIWGWRHVFTHGVHMRAGSNPWVCQSY